MEGLCAGESVALDDAYGDGVSPPLRATRPATRLRPHSAMWLSREHVPHRASRARSTPPPTRSAATADVLDNARLALPAMWSADGHRADPLSGPAGHGHLRPRHLMSAQRQRPDRRLRQRDRSRVRQGMPRLVIPSHCIGHRLRTLDVLIVGRRRSRADDPPVIGSPRARIPIPAP